MFNASRSVQRTVVVQNAPLCYQILITGAPRSCLAALVATHAGAAVCARSSRWTLHPSLSCRTLVAGPSRRPTLALARRCTCWLGIRCSLSFRCNTRRHLGTLLRRWCPVECAGRIIKRIYILLYIKTVRTFDNLSKREWNELMTSFDFTEKIV